MQFGCNGSQTFTKPAMTGIGRMACVPVECLVYVRQLQGRFESANLGCAGEPSGGSFEHEADHRRAFKQKRDEQKAFNGNINTTAEPQLADMAVREVQLSIGADVVDQMRKPQILFHCQSIAANVWVFCIDGTQPSIAE